MLTNCFGFLARQLPVSDENRIKRSTARLVPCHISARIYLDFVQVKYTSMYSYWHECTLVVQMYVHIYIYIYMCVYVRMYISKQVKFTL
jgi:hypothetical protein